ncbi:hypothetical protein CP533_4996 [Ophiocordyceps camponoti-saundersi (nom. inval.)]|nr:hypothetical protein CP533_4996 [Ophiocordyceps camponoti-saundersi (nom. inval.)]
MSVPKKCQVLVIGGGPAGSYASTVLAREGVDVVTLEADHFPRYHVGESMLPSLRYYLKFIGFYEKFLETKWYQKDGAAVFLNRTQPYGCINFKTEDRPEGYAWNVTRSDFDDQLFKYAGECGAKIFDGTKVNEIQFEKCADMKIHGQTADDLKPGRPVSATWSRKDGTKGSISFDYLIDGSGRQGVLSTKYLKNRSFNESFRSIAFWGYWKNTGVTHKGTPREGYTTFEALGDGSGWCWFIPLHDGTTSVGFVQNQKIATERKKASDGSTKTLYMESFKLLEAFTPLFKDAELVEEKGIKSTSDWSYSATTYAMPYARIVGDAGAFIDPLLSTGVHLALTGGLSAAATVMASIRGDLDEEAAASWHAKKISDSYSRIFLTVSALMEQIWAQEKPVIHDLNEIGYQRAFVTLAPVMQGAVDVQHAEDLTQKDVTKAINFCTSAFDYFEQDKKDVLIERLKQKGINLANMDKDSTKELEKFQKELSVEEARVLENLRAKQLYNEYYGEGRAEVDAIDGLELNMIMGKLTLVATSA